MILTKRKGKNYGVYITCEIGQLENTSFWDSPPDSIDHVGIEYLRGRYPCITTEKEGREFKRLFKDLMQQEFPESKHEAEIRSLEAQISGLKESKTADELRIVKNFLKHMPKTYRQRSMNFTVVKDILMNGTSTSGMTSCCDKCLELGIDPYGYDLKPVHEKGGGEE